LQSSIGGDEPRCAAVRGLGESTARSWGQILQSSILSRRQAGTPQVRSAGVRIAAPSCFVLDLADVVVAAGLRAAVDGGHMLDCKI
jgi:hypothetical protein